MRGAQEQHIAPGKELDDGEELLAEPTGRRRAARLTHQQGDRQHAQRKQTGAAEEHPTPSEPLSHSLRPYLPDDPSDEESGGHRSDRRRPVLGNHGLAEVGQPDGGKTGGHQPLRAAQHGKQRKRAGQSASERRDHQAG